MMNSEQMISIYEAVTSLTGQMLDAAKSGDWENLSQLESHCAGHVQILKNGEPAAPLAADTRARKVAMIHQILANDRAIRDVTEPWMAHLSAMMNSAGTERKLSSAYDAHRPG